MKLRTVAVFGIGYVLGTKAGRERYAQIVEAVQTATQRFDEVRRERGKPAQHGKNGTNGLDSYLDEPSRN